MNKNETYYPLFVRNREISCNLPATWGAGL